MTEKLHPHKMPPEGDDAELVSMKFGYKLPSVEEYVDGIVSSRAFRLLLLDELMGYRNAWLEQAAEVAELFVPTSLSTQTQGELIGERIRKLKEKP